jgi:hypothetical protein
MYQFTLKLFALFSLILPILALAVPVRKEVGEVENRAMHTGGRVRLPCHHLLVMLTSRLIGNLVHTWPR